MKEVIGLHSAKNKNEHSWDFLLLHKHWTFLDADYLNKNNLHIVMPPPKDQQKAKEWREKLLLVWKSPERRIRVSELLKGRKRSEETKRKISEYGKTRIGEKNPFYGRRHTEETKITISKANRGKNSSRYGKPPWNKGIKYSEDIRKSMSALAKKNFTEKPEIRKKMSIAHKGKKFSEEHKNKISEKIKVFYIENPEFNKLKNNPLWQGGVSFEPYNVLFNKNFKEIVKKRYGEKCVYCNREDKCVVHHTNYIKSHSSLINGVWVCASCNSKFNVNRDYWFAYWCYVLSIEPEDNIKEAEKIVSMSDEDLINFMKNDI